MTTGYRTGVIEVAPRVFAFVQEGGMTNAGFIVGDEGVLVIDALMTPSLATRLLSEIRRVSRAPVRFLVNTHYHGDHTFGNQYFLPAPIIAHANCREELIQKWDATMQRFKTMRPEQVPEFEQVRLTPPDVTFQDGMTIRLGERVVELKYLGWAHTRGDTCLYLPQEKVVFAGDIAFHKYFPVCMDAHITSWIRVISEVERLDATTLIPGHGPIGSKADIQELKDLLSILKEEVRRCYEAGMSAEQAAQEVKVAKYASWGMQERLPLAVQRLYVELKGELG
jgi:cyclase